MAQCDLLVAERRIAEFGLFRLRDSICGDWRVFAHLFFILTLYSTYGWNVGTTVKAPRADGTESVLVATEYNRDLAHIDSIPKQYLDSLGVAVSIAKELSSKFLLWY